MYLYTCLHFRELLAEQVSSRRNTQKTRAVRKIRSSHRFNVKKQNFEVERRYAGKICAQAPVDRDIDDYDRPDWS